MLPRKGSIRNLGVFFVPQEAHAKLSCGTTESKRHERRYRRTSPISPLMPQLEASGLLALRSCLLVNESWIDEDDADGTDFAMTGVNRVLLAVEGENGEDDDVRNGNFVRNSGSTSPRHVLRDIICLMRGSIPGVVGVMLVANMGRLAARPLRMIVAGVAPGRRMRHVNIPNFLGVMPATTGKSNLDRVFGKVLGLH